MKYQKMIQAIKTGFHELKNKLTQKEVNQVLKLFSNIDEVVVAFDVHYSTANSWRTGENKPNGANKMAFRILLNLECNE